MKLAFKYNLWDFNAPTFEALQAAKEGDSKARQKALTDLFSGSEPEKVTLSGDLGEIGNTLVLFDNDLSAMAEDYLITVHFELDHEELASYVGNLTCKYEAGSAARALLDDSTTFELRPGKSDDEVKGTKQVLVGPESDQ